MNQEKTAMDFVNDSLEKYFGFNGIFIKEECPELRLDIRRLLFIEWTCPLWKTGRMSYVLESLLKDLEKSDLKLKDKFIEYVKTSNFSVIFGDSLVYYFSEIIDHFICLEKPNAKDTLEIVKFALTFPVKVFINIQRSGE